MDKKTIDNMTRDLLGLAPEILEAADRAEEKIRDRFAELDRIAMYNQYKVLSAFRKNRLSDSHFSWNTGYGYDDAGREVTEKIFADIFHTDKALVRTQIVNGTHALSLVLTGILRPGDELIYATGSPYDTLEETIGIRGEGKGSLMEYGVTYKQVELKEDGSLDVPAILAAITDRTKMVCLQRSTGYAWRPALTVDDIGECCRAIKESWPDVVIMADNCYGEFLDVKEPTDVGVDILAGSLIKNPGGGLALGGGYVAGRGDLVDLVSYRLTTPGLGTEVGLTFGQTRTMLQGLFIAPQVVAGAIKGALLLSQIFTDLGYDVCPTPTETRSDIIQAVALGSEEAMVSFCKGIQAASVVDAFVEPEPYPMPGYDDPVVMAAGNFVQGSSIELSADGPIRPPYIVYFQGGMTYDHSKLGVLTAMEQMRKDGLLRL